MYVCTTMTLRTHKKGGGGQRWLLGGLGAPKNVLLSLVKEGLKWLLTQVAVNTSSTVNIKPGLLIYCKL